MELSALDPETRRHGEGLAERVYYPNHMGVEGGRYKRFNIHNIVGGVV